MKISELISQAWAEVRESGVPESMQEVAFKEAMETLRQNADADSAKGHSSGASKGSTKRSQRRVNKSMHAVSSGDSDFPTEDEFFGSLSTESGVSEADLRDVLHLQPGGAVQVTAPIKDLGDSASEQAKSVIALVAGSRLHGLGEKPVKRDAVRDELERKHCYDRNNFSAKHLGPMKGFNAAGTKEIVATSKWVAEFSLAVQTALKQDGASRAGERSSASRSGTKSAARMGAKKAPRKSAPQRTSTPRAKRKTSTPGPKALVESLIAEGFFSEPRTIGDIQDRLRHKKGVILKLTDLSPALVRLLRQNKLDRERAKNNQYEYSVPS